MTTYANQNIVTISKDKCVNDFLQIRNDDWQDAAKTLTPSGFILYIYLASNNDGFMLALSQKAVEDATGLSKASYHRAFDDLCKNGYLSCDKEHKYTFSTSII